MILFTICYNITWDHSLQRILIIILDCGARRFNGCSALQLCLVGQAGSGAHY